MARLLRFVLPGQSQHVIQRGNKRGIIFVDDEDFQFYRDKLADACERFECDIHVLMTPQTEDGISKVMQSLGRSYVQYFNHRYNRTSTFWGGRYKATLLYSELYLLTCYCYIELNPVRAGMVDYPSQYPWSSYQYNARWIKDDLVTDHTIYRRLGNNQQIRQDAYRQLFRRHLGKEILESIREATNKSWVLGNDRFREKIEKMTQRQAMPKARGGDRKSAEYRKSIFNRV